MEGEESVMLQMLPMTTSNDNEDLVSSAYQEAAALPCDPPDEDFIGARIPGYEIIRVLGRGGQGTVSEAIQTATSRRVALKVISADSTDSAGWSRFQREVHLLARLNHPHLVTVYDSGQTNGSFFYAMELVEGRPLDAYVDEVGLEQRDTLALFAKVCAAVHAAHQRGVIHRDLKPANILVDADGQPRILDFGLARSTLTGERDLPTTTAVTNDGGFFGTIKWASPEQVSRSPDDVDVRSDVYSLGVILYQLLTTAPPYDTTGSLCESVDNIVNTVPEQPSMLDRTISDDVESIVLRCLTKEPERRYGAVGELAADVRRYLAGEPIEAKRDSRLYVLRKTLLRHRVLASAAGLALLIGIGFGIVMAVLYQQARAAQADAEQEAATLRAELQQVRDDLVEPANWTDTFKTARVLEKLPPDEAWQVLQSAWKQMSEDHPKQQLLKAARFAQFEYLPRVLHLGMTDPSLAVQKWSITYLRDIAFVDFANDFSAYEAWHAQYGDLPLADVLEANCRRFIDALQKLDLAARGQRLQQLNVADTFRDHPPIAELAKKLGMVELLMACLTGDDMPFGSVRAAGRTLRHLPLDEAFLREHILPLIDDERPEVRNQAIGLLGEQQAVFAIEPLLAQMKRMLRDNHAKRRLSTIAQAFASIGDPRVIPDLIAIIAADNTYDTVYGVGYFGLGRLTGVDYDESHDGAWWREWWQNNRRRFPAKIAQREIPELEPVEAVSASQPASQTEPRQNEAWPAEKLHAGGNDRMAYFLIGPAAESKAPEEGYRLLLVLPGGDGSADFLPFVKRLTENAVGDRHLVAQLVTPRWTADQANQVVWPTRRQKIKAARFATEAFMHAVVDDVKRRYKIDEHYVFALGWSSGGPPVYADLVNPKSPLAGVFVAMSVFKPDELGDLSVAKGKGVYILHSPKDFIPLRFAESARDLLAKCGATTTLDTYAGGHGWRGDVYGDIRRGMRWLEQHSARAEKGSQ